MPPERPLVECTRWFNILATRFPMLSRAQVRTLALWSFAATLTQHIGSTTCAFFLARLFEQPQANFRQRLREFYWPAEQKPGRQRLELDVSACFAPLVRWILALARRAGAPKSAPEQLLLALDATLIGDRLVVLSLSVVFRGSALPVAWKMVPANKKGAWLPCCIDLLDLVADALPPRSGPPPAASPMPVFVLCDRGLQSRRLFQAICRQGFHPLMRLTRLGCWCPLGQPHWYRLASLLPGPGRYYLGQGHLFKTKPLRCTLVALWEEGYEAPWLLMTDLPPARCQGRFYGLRSWIEQGFRCLKTGAYRCERLRVIDPARAERVFLVLAVSLLWTHAVGSQEQHAEEPSMLSGVIVAGVRRHLGVHRVGWIALLVAALRGEPMPAPARLLMLPRPVGYAGTKVVLRAPP